MFESVRDFVDPETVAPAARGTRRPTMRNPDDPDDLEHRLQVVMGYVSPERLREFLDLMARAVAVEDARVIRREIEAERLAQSDGAGVDDRESPAGT